MAGRPFAWFDDHLSDADESFLAAHPGVGEFLLVRVDGRGGLTDAHLSQAAGWFGGRGS